jgi:hypothetical protein
METTFKSLLFFSVLHVFLCLFLGHFPAAINGPDKFCTLANTWTKSGKPDMAGMGPIHGPSMAIQLITRNIYTLRWFENVADKVRMNVHLLM